jgi:hypothetical protein
MCQSMSAVTSLLLEFQCFYILRVTCVLVYIRYIQGLSQSRLSAANVALPSVVDATTAL